MAGAVFILLFRLRMRFLLLILTWLAFPFGLRADEAGRRILAEINFARTQPQAYASIVAQSAGSSRAVAETVRFLERVTPLPPLEHSSGLAQSALSHVFDQGRTGGFGHAGSDGAHSFERIARYGQWQGSVGENIDYGNSSPRAIVVRLIVDEGVMGRKHRANIFSKSFRVAGVAAGSHARYGAMCVMDFAGDFIERGRGLADR